MFTALVVVIVF